MGNEMGNQNVSRMQEEDSTKLEASKESAEVSVASINANCVEDANQQVSTPKEVFHEYNTGFASGDSSRAGDPKQTINGGEQDKTEAQAPKGSLKVPIGSKNHNGMDGEMQLVSSIDDGKFHPRTGSTSKENLPRTMDNQIQRQASSATGFASGDSSRAGDPKQTINGGEQDRTEAQAPEGSLKVPKGSNNHNGMDGEMQLVSSIDDGKFHQLTGSPSKENLPRTTDNQIQRQASSATEVATEGEETWTLSLDTKLMVCPPRTTELDTIKSEKHESSILRTDLLISSSEDQKTNEHTSSSEDSLRTTNENQTQSQASIGGEGEETGNLSLDSTSMVPNPQSVESQTVTNQHKSTTSHAESAVPSSETGNSNELTGSASEDISTRTNDNQVQRQESTGGEWKEERTSSLNTKSRILNPDSMVVENLKSHDQESTDAHTEVFVEASSKLAGSSGDILISSRPRDSEEEGQRPEDDITHILEESYIPHSYTEVEIMGEDVPMENMESQYKEVVVIGNINEMKSDIINGIEFENSVNEEQELTLLNALGSYVVLTNNRIMIKNGSESEQKRYESNKTLLSDGLVDESNANEINICQSEFVAVGSDHEEEITGIELCDSDKPIIQSGLQIDDENVPLYVFKLNMQDSNQSLISEISCKELEGETKMVVMDIVPTESILTDSYHEEGKLPTCSSSSMDPTKNKFIIGLMEKTEDPDLIGKIQEGWGTIDSNLPQLQPVEPLENFLPPDPVSLDKSQVPKQATLIETETVDSRSGSTIVSDQSSCDQVDVRKTSYFDPKNSTVETMVALENEKSGQDLSQHQGLDQSYYQEFSTVALVPSSMSSDGSQRQESTFDLTNNEINHDNINGNFDLREKSSLGLYMPRKESEAPESQSEKSFGEKGLVSSFENCVFDTKETKSIAEVELNAEISKLPNLDFEFPPEARIEESNRNPILSPEETENGEEFTFLEIQLEDINFHVEVGKPLSFDLELPLEERIEESDHSPLLAAKDAGTEPYEEMSAEKHVISLERTSSEKLTPLLDFLKEGEKYENESAKKSKGHVAKKSATSSRVREKRKPKYSLFCNCMSCTEVIQ